MNESEWLSSTDLHKLLYFASTKYDRKIRMFSIACVKRVLCVYNHEVTCFVDFAEQVFDDKESIRDLQAMAQLDAVATYQAPFQLARASPVLAAIGVMDGILADTGWADHGCLDVFREIFGNPFQVVSIPATPTIIDLAYRVYTTGAGTEKLATLLTGEGQKHLREGTWHPKGCWVLDSILGKNV